MLECTVKIFTLSTCGHCRNAKKFLTDCGVVYDCVEVDKLTGEERQVILEEVRSVNPSCSFPTIVIGEVVIVGFREDKLREALRL